MSGIRGAAIQWRGISCPFVLLDPSRLIITNSVDGVSREESAIKAGFPDRDLTGLDYAFQAFRDKGRAVAPDLNEQSADSRRPVGWGPHFQRRR